MSKSPQPKPEEPGEIHHDISHVAPKTESSAKYRRRPTVNPMLALLLIATLALFIWELIKRQ